MTPCRRSGISKKVMRNQARCLRLPWVALAAMVGMLWGGADVSACTSRDAPKARSCCARQRPADYGCCTTSDNVPGGTLPSPDRVPGTGFTGIRPSSCGTCVCGPSSPARQSERRETRTSEESSSEASLDSLHISHSSHPSLASSPATQTELSPPHTPLYLRVERLII